MLISASTSQKQQPLITRMSSPEGRPHELAVMRGYRFDLAKRSMLIAIEVNYWLFSNGTDSGNSNFKSSRTVLVGLGKTLTKK